MQNIVLMIANVIFYSWWDWRFLALIFFSAGMNYYCAKKIHLESNERDKVLWLRINLFLNLSLLGVFKYFNFFIANVNDSLTLLGFNVHLQTLNIILPLGISFYTLQAISYVVDVYVEKMDPIDSCFDFILYLSFFPFLTAGPIVRAIDFFPQLKQQRTATSEDYHAGLWLIFWGLFQKVVIADNCAVIVDNVFRPNALVGGGDVLLGVFFFTFQIYADFAGYSDMAIGIARIFGFQIKWNFNLPYLAENPKDFWDRWHISLTSWLRDYVFSPLLYSSMLSSKHRKHIKLRVYSSIGVTFLISGLWHGANWTFILWGIFHGSFLILHDYLKIKIPLFKPIKILSMFILINISWLFFRANSFSQIKSMLLSVGSGFSVNLEHRGMWEIAIYIFILMSLQCIQKKKNDLLFIQNYKIYRYYIYLILLLFIFISGKFVSRQFIYTAF
ncbi:MAG: MBOAT family protein [Oligoflexia bacterium]|nr:MBOAT family protein [Oligoflexia bacterium]